MPGLEAIERPPVGPEVHENDDGLHRGRLLSAAPHEPTAGGVEDHSGGGQEL